MATVADIVVFTILMSTVVVSVVALDVVASVAVAGKLIHNADTFLLDTNVKRLTDYY